MTLAGEIARSTRGTSFHAVIVARREIPDGDSTARDGARMVGSMTGRRVVAVGIVGTSLDGNARWNGDTVDAGRATGLGKGRGASGDVVGQRLHLPLLSFQQTVRSEESGCLFDGGHADLLADDSVLLVAGQPCHCQLPPVSSIRLLIIAVTSQILRCGVSGGDEAGK